MPASPVFSKMQAVSQSRCSQPALACKAVRLARPAQAFAARYRNRQCDRSSFTAVVTRAGKLCQGFPMLPAPGSRLCSCAYSSYLALQPLRPMPRRRQCAPTSGERCRPRSCPRVAAACARRCSLLVISSSSLVGCRLETPVCLPFYSAILLHVSDTLAAAPCLAASFANGCRASLPLAPFFPVPGFSKSACVFHCARSGFSELWSCRRSLGAATSSRGSCCSRWGARLPASNRCWQWLK